MKNSAVTKTHVARRERPTQPGQQAQTVERRHQAALAQIDAIDRRQAVREILVQRQPHPMATPLPDPEVSTRGPQEPANAIPEGSSVAFYEPPALSVSIITGLLLTAVFLFGLTVGRWL